MARSFRRSPPEPSAALLARPRLAALLLGRWESRVTSLVGGAGLGKTTVLAQAVAENEHAAHGEDLWFGLEAHDADADRLARGVAAALGAEVAPGAPLAPAVAEALWQRSPVQVCLVFDDVHRLPAASSGALWLAELVNSLPANGHVVLAGRTEPPVPLARLDALGAVLRLGEHDLRFSDDELDGFAAGRGVDPATLVGTGGWPALAEMSANAHVEQPDDVAGAYMWAEVLEPLGPERRRVLAVLADLGGGDAELIGAALGEPVDLARALEGVPLVAHTVDGWHVAHALWRQAPGLALDADARVVTRQRAVAHLTSQFRFDEAFDMVEDAAAWDLAPAVLRAACLASDRLTSSQLERWWDSSPLDVRTSLPGWLARGLLAGFSTPAAATEPLQHAIELCRTAGDVDAEMSAIAQLSRLAWFAQDENVIVELVARVTELEATGHPRAVALATVARAAMADLTGDDDAMLTFLDGIEPGDLDRAWELLVSFWAAQVRLGLGETAPIHRIVERLHATDDPALRGAGMAMRLSALWAEGRVDDVVAGLPAMLEAMQGAGVINNLYLALNGACLATARTGDVVGARRWFDASLETAPATPNGDLSPRSAVALAYVNLAEGREKHAAIGLQTAIESHGLDQGVERDTWRQHIAVTYVLLPETRAHWDAKPLRGHLRTGHRMAQAVVAVREGRADPVLRDLDLPEPGVVRSVLDVRLAVELAVGLVEAGRHADARTLLAAIGPPGRAALRDLTTSGHRQARPAKVLLASVPAAPARRTWLSVLGRLSLTRDDPAGEAVVDPDLRRTKLRAMLGYLVVQRQTTRAALIAAVWPDLDERAAANNMAVTLNRLQRVLEPWRPPGEPGYLLRVDGSALRLVAGDHLRIDVDDFERHLAAAAKAEADGVPSLALTHDLAVAELYRGELLADVPEDEWFALERERHRTRFVGAAVRAGQLLLGHSAPGEAEDVARQALAADRWAEGAYAVLVGAAIARRDYAAANLQMDLCLDALRELGAEPSWTTRQLQRRLSSVS